MQSMLLLTVDKVEATSGRGGSSDDFSVSEIMVNSTETNHWIQPDGSVVVYVAKGDVVDISVEAKRGGGALQGSSATVLSIGATDEIDLTATAVDLNGTLNVSGVATFQAAPVFPDGSIALADLDIDGGTDINAALVDADLFIVDDGAGGTNRKMAASRLTTYINANANFASVGKAIAMAIVFG